MLTKKFLIIFLSTIFCIHLVIAPPEKGTSSFADDPDAIDYSNISMPTPPPDPQIIAARARAREEAKNAPIWRSNSFQKPVFKTETKPKQGPDVVDSNGRCGRWC